MKKCPNCHEETIPLQWILIGKANEQKGRCYVCDNCGERIKKKRFLGFVLDFDVELVIILTLVLLYFFHSLLIPFLISVSLIVLMHFLINIFATLQIADETYCRGDMTKIGAFFGLVAMIGIIAYMIYFFILQPLLR